MKVDGRVLTIASQLENRLMGRKSFGTISGSRTQPNLACSGLITPGSDRELVVPALAEYNLADDDLVLGVYLPEYFRVIIHKCTACIVKVLLLRYQLIDVDFFEVIDREVDLLQSHLRGIDLELVESLWLAREALRMR